ncbi:acetamidase/formamidase family protein [Sphingosinicella rhizophila]|uniref:Acetamidase/formamidase family protein n=1 Tax=Sphingosinicella rhizophila TaxID=3050082 RepID=A0ABU3Q8N1_9SPHN|nr:acetamidase/formamidase family protein [Sphingosinicella sp. GR2756]MDT9599759.1 acetamidase/formamidase family protein [Sphingosinicella sp. GR2756]
MNKILRRTPSRGVALLAAVFFPTAVFAKAADQAPTAREHTLKASPSTVVWGYFDGSKSPVLTIEPGDTVNVETMVTGARILRLLGVPERVIRPSMIEMDEKVKQEGSHILVGPIAIRGAEPGDVLEIRIRDMAMAEPWAVNVFTPGGGTLPHLFPYQGGKFVPIDLKRKVATITSGVEVPVRPFFGNIGVGPPVLVGRLSSRPPGYHGGNFDNKELVAGSTLYLPVHVKGGLLSVGDGHAAQGDGEVNGSALEASLRGKLQIFLRKDLKLRWPQAETPTHYITMGLDPDLDEAAKRAVEEMVEYLVSTKGLSREEAYILCSAAVDLRVTQVVDGTKGIHAMLPKSVFVKSAVR